MLELLKKMLESGQTLFGLYTVMIIALLIIWQSPARIVDKKLRVYMLSGIFILLLALTIATIINSKNDTQAITPSAIIVPDTKLPSNVCGNISGSGISVEGGFNADCSTNTTNTTINNDTDKRQ